MLLSAARIEKIMVVSCLTNKHETAIIIIEGEGVKMIDFKIYGFYLNNGVLLTKVAKTSKSAAAEWFRQTYPHRYFDYIAEM